MNDQLKKHSAWILRGIDKGYSPNKVAGLFNRHRAMEGDTVTAAEIRAFVKPALERRTANMRVLICNKWDKDLVI